MAFDEHQRRDLRHLAWLAAAIAVAGLLGGAVAYGAELILNAQAPFEWSRLAPQSLVGGAAALFGVFLLANSDTSTPSAVLRACVFAVACGASWQPIFDATRSIVGQEVSAASATKQISGAFANVQNVSINGPEAPDSAAIEGSIESATQALRDLARVSPDRVPDDAKKSTVALIKYLADAKQNSPEAFQDPDLKSKVDQFQGKAIDVYPEIALLAEVAQLRDF